MQRVKKKKNNAKVTMTVHELEIEKRKTAREITEKVNLLFLTVLAEEYNFTEQQIVDILETVTRWAEYIDSKLVPLDKTRDIIEKKTGVKIRGWNNAR